MMQPTHAITGAAVGALIPNPYLAFIAGIIVHLLVDKIPHHWFEEQKKRNITVVVEYLITIVFITFLITNKITNPSIYAGIAGSLVVDIVLVGIPPVMKSKLGEWHTNRQPHIYGKYYWVAIDVAVMAAAFAILAFKLR